MGLDADWPIPPCLSVLSVQQRQQLEGVVYSSRFALALFFSPDAILNVPWGAKYVTDSSCIRYVAVDSKKRGAGVSVFLSAPQFVPLTCISLTAFVRPLRRPRPWPLPRRTYQRPVWPGTPGARQGGCPANHLAGAAQAAPWPASTNQHQVSEVAVLPGESSVRCNLNSSPKAAFDSRPLPLSLAGADLGA